MLVHNAGHGGPDSGAVGIKGILEKRINRNVVDQLALLCDKEGIPHADTRVGDEEMRVNEVTKKLNKIIAGREDAEGISVHHNAGGGDGFEIIYQMNNPKSKELALCIKAEFEKLNNFRKVYCKPSTAVPHKDYFGFLRDSKCPAVITEFAFIDSKDVEAVDTLAEQHLEALAIFNGYKKYKKLK